MLHSLKRVSLQVFLVLLIIAALVCIPAAFVSFSSLSSGLTWSKLIASGFITILYLVLALCNLLPAHKRGMTPFCIAGLSTTVATYVFILYYVWRPEGSSDSMGSYFTWLSAQWRLVLLASFFSLSFAQAGILLRIGIQHSAVHTLRKVALLADAALVAIVLISLITDATHGILLVRVSYFVFSISLFITAITLVAHELSKISKPVAAETLR